MIILYFNVFLYFALLVNYINKKRVNSVQIIVLLFYILFACASCYIVENNIFNKTFGFYNLDNLSIIPYICNFITITIIISLLKERDIKIFSNIDIIPSRYLKILEYFVIFLSFIYVILQYEWYQLFSNIELKDIYESNRFGEQTFQFPNRWMNIVFFRSKQLFNIICPYIYLIEFTKLCNKNIHKRPIIIILILFIPSIISNALLANRGGIVFSTAAMLFFIAYFWKYLNPKIHQYIFIGGCLFSVLIIMYFAAITISRNEGNIDESFNGFLRYLGETFPNLGLRIWDVSDKYLYGMRMYPSLYSCFEDMPYVGNSHGEFISVYERISGFPIDNFKTFYGDLYIEFGPILPFFIVFLFVKLVQYLFKKLGNYTFSIILIYQVYMTLIWGLFGAKISEQDIIGILLSSVIVYYANRKLKQIVNSKNYKKTWELR